MLRKLKQGLDAGRSRIRTDLEAIFDGYSGISSAKRTGQQDSSEDDSDTVNSWLNKIERMKDAGDERLRDVFAAPINLLLPGFIPPVHKKTPEQYEYLEQILDKETFVFQQLQPRERRTVLQALERFPVNKGTEIYKEDDVGDYVYVVESGSVQFVGDAVQRDAMDPVATKGHVFGSLALLYDCPRPVTAIASEDCVLWRLDQGTFRRILFMYVHKDENDVKQWLKKVPFMHDLDDVTLTRIALAVSTEEFKAGDEVVKKGDEVKAFYIVKQGKLKGTDIVVGESKYDDVVMGPGDYFGDAAILKNESAYGNVVALEATTVLCLTQKAFLKLCGSMQSLILRAHDRKKLELLPVEGKPELKDDELDALVSMIVDLTFPKGHHFYQQGIQSSAPALFLVRSGKVSVRSPLEEAMETLIGLFGYETTSGETSITAGGYFGADMLKQPSEREKNLPQFTITATEDCVVGMLTAGAFWSVISARPKEYEIGLQQLEKHRLLGAGTFGQVFLVSEKGTSESYALKIQSKRKTIEHQQVEGVVREKNIMARLDHPFIIKLVSAFQDEPNIYMLTALYQGGELRSLVWSGLRVGMPEKAAAFYAANILEGIAFMHQRKILHRDLKPENVLLDADGYTVLIDLGFARVVRGKTYTFCGTPMYIAPEVIRQRGYGASADIWSWAVMIYEFIVGITPFYDREMSQMDLFKRISRGEFEFPPRSFMSGEARNLIKQLLAPDPTERLGCLAGGVSDIRVHPWFQEHVSFEGIAKKKEIPPWKPKVKDPLDVDNFKKWKEPESKNEEEPLSRREQLMFKDF